MKDYRIVSVTGDFKLEDIVKLYMKGGWVPLGGVSTVQTKTGSIKYSQAMIKE